jgi:hypothetical protein
LRRVRSRTGIAIGETENLVTARNVFPQPSIGTCRTTVIAPVRTLNELTPQFERVPTLKDRGFRLPKP